MKVVDGLLNAKRPKPAAPKPSPEGFQWPSQRDPDAQEHAEKLAASLQELLPARDWKHVDLARELWGTMGANDAPRNVSRVRSWVLGELPIPNEETAAYVAQVLDVPMARLLKPTIKFNPKPDMIRDRSPNGVNLWKSGKKGKTKAKVAAKAAAKTPSGRDREKQRAYNEAYRKRQKEKKEGKGKRKYTKRAALNGSEEGTSWILADGVEPPDYTISSVEDVPGHVKLQVTAIVPHKRAMAVLHMLQYGEAQEK